MSWRETLGATPSTKSPYAHNTQNAQKPIAAGNCADIADCAYRDTEEDSRLLETLALVCKELPIQPMKVLSALDEQNIKDWRNGEISNAALSEFARLLLQRREMDQGKRPSNFSKRATCKHCGPVWLWVSGEFLGCPWCWNRASDKPIPRPCSIHCGNCIHFKRIDHPHLGHCAKGEPEAIAGLWDTDRRKCDFYVPTPKPSIKS